MADLQLFAGFGHRAAIHLCSARTVVGVLSDFAGGLLRRLFTSSDLVVMVYAANVFQPSR